MDINLLVLNVGNSRLAVGVFEAGTLNFVTRIPHAQQKDWPGILAEAWKKIDGKDNAAVAGVCVNSPLQQSLEEIIKQICNRTVQWVGQQIELPINVLTENPQETGVDRIVNIAAAYEQMGKGCVVVDTGSAVTINFCNDNSDFLGGAIAPGVNMMLDALHEKTTGLPRVDFALPQGSIGQSTTQAILHGIYSSVRGLVKELVENYATESGSWPEIIATGGDAEMLFKDWELIHAVSPDLTLYGVALAYANHHIKHGT